MILNWYIYFLHCLRSHFDCNLWHNMSLSIETKFKQSKTTLTSWSRGYSQTHCKILKMLVACYTRSHGWRWQITRLIISVVFPSILPFSQVWADAYPSCKIWKLYYNRKLIVGFRLPASRAAISLAFARASSDMAFSNDFGVLFLEIYKKMIYV